MGGKAVRTARSKGLLQPLNCWLVISEVKDLLQGSFNRDPRSRLPCPNPLVLSVALRDWTMGAWAGGVGWPLDSYRVIWGMWPLCV